ncbi:MAG: hypothetical protein IJH64_05790 [Oscillospiraceae bacterium]|nr:hypothetical protein [Oscillospiraceae bacterium]
MNLEDKITSFKDILVSEEDAITRKIANNPDDGYFVAWLLLERAAGFFNDEGFIPIEVVNAINDCIDKAKKQ